MFSPPEILHSETVACEYNHHTRHVSLQTSVPDLFLPCAEVNRIWFDNVEPPEVDDTLHGAAL